MPGRLRYDVDVLAAIFGGRQAMIESPLIKELAAEFKREMLLEFLEGRFGPLPSAVSDDLRKIDDVDRLTALGRWAAQCPDLAAFRTRLTA
jgi:hypothetical protein